MTVTGVRFDSEYEIIADFDDKTEVKIYMFWKFSTSIENSIRFILIKRFGLKLMQYHGKLSHSVHDPAQFQIIFNNGVLTQPETAKYLQAIGLYLHEDHDRGTDVMRATMQICLHLIDDLSNNKVMSSGGY